MTLAATTSDARSSPRIAIVSDPLVQRGGAERTVQAMADAFPDAPIHALLYSPTRGPASLAPRVRTSFLQRLPQASHRHRAFLPLFPAAIESIDLRGYDVVVSSHHTVAKGVLRGADQLHVCYCHTPMRALWERTFDELETLPSAARPAAAALFSRLRVWDHATASRVDHFLANSVVTQRRIRRHYGRESTILHPPIETERFTPGGAVEEYYLIASRDVPYKRLDVAIDAIRSLRRRVLVVGGRADGGSRDPYVERLGHVDDERLLALMRGARALLFPQYEDFGMTPLEVAACGRPTIAFAAGGALETIVDGVTGVHVARQEARAFADAIERFERETFDPTRIRAHAENFSRDRFVRKLREFVNARLAES